MIWKIKTLENTRTHIEKLFHLAPKAEQPLEIRHSRAQRLEYGPLSITSELKMKNQDPVKARSKYLPVDEGKESKLQFYLASTLYPSLGSCVGLYIISVHTRLPEMNSEIKFRDTRPAASVNRSISWPNSRRGPLDASADQSEIRVRPD